MRSQCQKIEEFIKLRERLRSKETHLMLKLANFKETFRVVETYFLSTYLCQNECLK